MTLQQQDAIWPTVQKIWATRNHRMITRRLADLLEIRGPHRANKIVWGGLDQTQSREAFFARLGQMRKEPEPLVELHYITCDCERCEAIREERKTQNGT